MQTFFESHTRIFLAMEFETFIAQYITPLPMYFEGEMVNACSYQDLYGLVVRHHNKLNDHRVENLRAHVDAVEWRGKDKLRCAVTWHYFTKGSDRVSRIDYFMKIVNDVPKIEMVEFRLPLPPQYGGDAEVFETAFIDA